MVEVVHDVVDHGFLVGLGGGDGKEGWNLRIKNLNFQVVGFDFLIPP